MGLDIDDILYGDDSPKNNFNNQEVKLEEKEGFDSFTSRNEKLKELYEVKKGNKNKKPKKTKYNDKNVGYTNILKYILSFVIDFFIFGIVFIIIWMLEGTVLLKIYGEVNRVLMLNGISIVVIEEVFLFTYFYFFPKDNNGSTLGMKMLGIKVTNKLNDKVTFFTNTCMNLTFWIYFLSINVGLVLSLETSNIDIGAIFIIIILLISLFFLNGFSAGKMVISPRNSKIKKEVQNESI